MILWKDRKRILGMPITFTVYSLSEDRLFIKTGLFNLRTEEIILYRIRDISLHRSFGQRIFGVGTVHICSSDHTCPELDVKNVRHSEKVKEMIHEQVEQMKLERRVRVNELIDGYDADSVPDDIVAERLDSAGYSLALSIDKKSIDALESAAGATISATKTAATEANAYKLALEAKRVLGRKGVPNEGRFLIASPEYLEVLMQDEHFIKQGDLSQEMVQQGVVGRIAGFNVFESNNMDYESTTRVSSKKTTTEVIAGHPNWCHRVMEWQTAVHLQDLSGSGKYIGASAVQGRKVYGLKVSKPQTLYIKRTETAT